MTKAMREARELGFEPRLTEPKSVVLPLHHSRRRARPTIDRKNDRLRVFQPVHNCERKLLQLDG